MNLAGLYGGTRNPHSWVKRVAITKDAVRGKKALHLVHGSDVARGILGVHLNWTRAGGKRWLVTDLRVYDWWDLIMDWGPGIEKEEEKEGEVGKEKLELCYGGGCVWRFAGVWGLPRGPEVLGRVLDSRAFWEAIGIWPVYGRVK